MPDLLQGGRSRGLLFSEEEIARAIEFGDDLGNLLRGFLGYPQQTLFARFGLKRERQYRLRVGVLRRNHHRPHACDHAGQHQDSHLSILKATVRCMF
jgi:hypothetical protein